MPAVYHTALLCIAPPHAAFDNSHENVSTKEQLKSWADRFTFDKYRTTACITEKSTMEAIGKFYIANMLNSGGFPSYKKPMIITLAALLVTFPGILCFLPPQASGQPWPEDARFAVWIAAPTSKPESALGAFMPYAKPYDDWKSMAKNGYNPSTYDPSSAVHMWSPIILAKAILDEPAKLLGLVNPSKLKTQIAMGSAIRKADWNVRRLLLLIPFYVFLQTYVVKVAFNLKDHADPRKRLGSKSANIPAMASTPDITVNVTEHVLDYTTYIQDPQKNYVNLVKRFTQAHDKWSGYQGHTFDGNNRATYLELFKPLKNTAIDSQEAPTRSTPHGTSTSSLAATPSSSSAGATARSTLSPGKPGPSKTFRPYVDVTKGRTVASTLAAHAGTTSHVALTPPETPATATPGMVPTMATTPAAPAAHLATPGTVMHPPPNYANYHVNLGHANGHPAAFGTYPPPFYGYPTNPAFPWPPTVPQFPPTQ